MTTIATAFKQTAAVDYVANLQAAIEKYNRLKAAFDKAKDQQERGRAQLADINKQLGEFDNIDERIDRQFAENLKAGNPATFLPTELIADRSEKVGLGRERDAVERALVSLEGEVEGAKKLFDAATVELARAKIPFVLAEAQAIADNISEMEQTIQQQRWKLSALLRSSEPHVTISFPMLIKQHATNPTKNYNMFPLNGTADGAKFEKFRAVWKKFFADLAIDAKAKLKF